MANRDSSDRQPHPGGRLGSVQMLMKSRPRHADPGQFGQQWVLDYDERGNLVGIDIDNASTKVDLERLVISKLPGSVETTPG